MPLSQKILLILLNLLVLFAIVYYAIFGRALRQDEDHLAIAMHLPQALISSDAVAVGEKYIAQDNASFITAMTNAGFTFIEQMGTGYFFEKNGVRFTAEGRMYSRYLMIYSTPAPVSQL